MGKLSLTCAGLITLTLVLTNDDGIDAPGLKALQAAVNLALPQRSVMIVAPDRQWSGCGHQVITDRPIQITARSPQAVSLDGTPADCVRLALTHFCPEVTLVLSGINAGGNLGSDIYMSGTVAAAREAALRGIPGIALSHYRHQQREFDWEQASQWAAQVIQKLILLPLPPGHFWNVNLPHPDLEAAAPELVFCPPCRQPLPASYRVEGDQFFYTGRYGDRLRDPGADVATCFAGNIAITQLSVF